ncbi:hypothetical protein SAY86_001853 [Trapa natans]|uniref:LOB domain-containing protein n=1 Tax=Trapa natans TaxID=22666 RepID=A0AAN7QZ11_TRANT|nr:hypothetical protein SAY86_001853 [Trapa natans]
MSSNINRIVEYCLLLQQLDTSSLFLACIPIDSCLSGMMIGHTSLPKTVWNFGEPEVGDRIRRCQICGVFLCVNSHVCKGSVSLSRSFSTPLPIPPAIVSPCAACKTLRRRCDEKCVLAPYFPPTDPAKFALAHRVFGASNIIKFLQDLPELKRADAVASMVYEADTRIRDPVYGCAGAICQLQKQVSELQAELAKAQAELVCIQCQQANLTHTLCMEMAAQPPAPQHSNDTCLAYIHQNAPSFQDNTMNPNQLLGQMALCGERLLSLYNKVLRLFLYQCKEQLKQTITDIARAIEDLDVEIFQVLSIRRHPSVEL